MAADSAQAYEPNRSYDDVLYESYAYSHTHPYHLHMVGKLFGLNPPDFRTAKVLELGCASGGNLFSLAVSYPDAQFLGLDLSGEQIALADRHKEAMGLDNINFMQADITAFDLKKHAGAYDYIICHGVYSWVPAPVRDAILEICQRCLTPNGLALVSYNTLPGWNSIRSLREMMLFHTKRFTNPAERINQARALLDFLIENVPDGNVAYKKMIEEERKLLKNSNDSYLFHDHLEETNTQFYFHEFVDHLRAHRLGYVGDSSIGTMYVGNMPKQAAEKLKALNDIVLQEQYFDFILNRRFRKSILCHDNLVPTRQMKPAQIFDFYLTTQMKPESMDPKKDITFKTGRGGNFVTHTEISGTLFLELVATGLKPVSAAELVRRTQKRLNLPMSKPVEDVLAQFGMELAIREFIQIYSDSPDFVTAVSKKPVAFAWARYQAGLPKCPGVTNTLHQMVHVDAVSCEVLQKLDGEHTEADLVKAMTEMVKSGRLNLNRNGAPITEDKEIAAELKKNIHLMLEKFAGQALLVG